MTQVTIIYLTTIVIIVTAIPATKTSTNEQKDGNKSDW